VRSNKTKPRVERPAVLSMALLHARRSPGVRPTGALLSHPASSQNVGTGWLPPEQCEQEYNGKRNSRQPKQSAATKSHGCSPLVLRRHNAKPAMRFQPERAGNYATCRSTLPRSSTGPIDLLFGALAPQSACAFLVLAAHLDSFSENWPVKRKPPALVGGLSVVERFIWARVESCLRLPSLPRASPGVRTPGRPRPPARDRGSLARTATSRPARPRGAGKAR
jgi:hypothetical protein